MLIAAVVAGFIIVSLLMETIFSPPSDQEDAHSDREVLE